MLIEDEIVSVTATQEHCTANEELEIKVFPDLIIPSGFTPNGDGINETFIPVGIGWQYEDYSFSVFDRWGEMIYQTTAQDNPWDETYLGNQVQMDTYVWQIEVRDIVDNKRHVFTGHVNVIR